MPRIGHGRNTLARKFQGQRIPRISTPYGLITFPKQLISHADFVIPVEIDFQWHNIYVIKRPGVEEFLRKMGEIYEVVVFTASVSKVRFSAFATCRKAKFGCSTPMQYLINLTSIKRSHIVSSAKVVTSTKGTTSRFVLLNSPIFFFKANQTTRTSPV